MFRSRSRRLLLTLSVVASFVGSVEPTAATVVRFDTVQGTYDLRLFDALMPNSAANFLGYVNSGRYDGTFVHRSVSGFVIQGGGFFFDEVAGSAPSISLDPPINDEPGGGVPGPSNVRGTIAMAKSGPNTVTSQWFVNLGNNSSLDDPNRPDGGFSAFGRVLGNGMDVVDAIAALPIFDLDGPTASLFNNVPLLDVPGGLIDNLILSNSVTLLNVPDGDYNFDGTVDGADLAVWEGSIGSTINSEADGNGNGIVDGADFLLWQQNLGATSALSSVNSVPEPNSALLAALAAAALMCRRFRIVA